MLLAVTCFLASKVSATCSTWGGWTPCGSNGLQTRFRTCFNLSNGEIKCTRQVRGCIPITTPAPTCGTCPSGCVPASRPMGVGENCDCPCTNENQCRSYQCDAGGRFFCRFFCGPGGPGRPIFA